MLVPQRKLSTAMQHFCERHVVPAVFFNHILALFVVVRVVVMSTFDPQ